MSATTFNLLATFWFVAALVSNPARAGSGGDLPSLKLELPSLYIQRFTIETGTCERGSWSRATGYRRKREIPVSCPRVEVEDRTANSILRLSDSNLLTLEVDKQFTHLAVPVGFEIIEIGFSRDSDPIGLLKSAGEELVAEWEWEKEWSLREVWRARTKTDEASPGAKVFTSLRSRGDISRKQLLQKQSFKINAPNAVSAHLLDGGMIQVEGRRILLSLHLNRRRIAAGWPGTRPFLRNVLQCNL